MSFLDQKKTIRIKKVNEVRQDFIDLYRQGAEQKLRASLDNLQAMNEQMRQITMARSPSMYGRLGRVVRDPDGSNIDKEITALHAIDMDAFGVYDDPIKGLYFVGKTPPIRLEIVSQTYVRNPPIPPTGRQRRSRDGGGYYQDVVSDYTYDCGPYLIFVPVSIVSNTALDQLHLIPERAPRVKARHPHHHTTDERPEHLHPVNYRATFCWSSFATPMTNAVAEFNIPQIFSMMRKFAGRYNADSPLERPEHVAEMATWMKRIEL